MPYERLLWQEAVGNVVAVVANMGVADTDFVGMDLDNFADGCQTLLRPIPSFSVLVAFDQTCRFPDGVQMSLFSTRHAAQR